MTKSYDAIHPGEILAEEFLAPLGISAAALARALHVPCNRVTRLIKGQAAVTPATSRRLGRALRTTPEFWLNLQMHYDLETDPKLLARLPVQPVETNNECRFAAPDGDFHTYTLVWSKRLMHIYYDGATCLKTPWLSQQGGRAPFDQPFILAIGFGTGKYDNAVSADTPMPVHLDVDYVRVWE